MSLPVLPDFDLAAARLAVVAIVGEGRMARVEAAGYLAVSRAELEARFAPANAARRVLEPVEVEDRPSAGPDAILVRLQGGATLEARVPVAAAGELRQARLLGHLNNRPLGLELEGDELRRSWVVGGEL